MLLETVTGRLVDIENPDPSTINIEDIAWGLSRMPRFCGHTITVIPYNVAQHCMFVADEVQILLSNHKLVEHLNIPDHVWTTWMVSEEFRNDIVRKALLHDAEEVYTGDWPSPIKRIPKLRPIIKHIEHKLHLAIFTALNVSPLTDEEEKLIKYADRIAQKIEAHAFMPSRGKHWPDLPDVSLERLQQFNVPLDSLTSYKMFMAKFEELQCS